VFVVLKIAIASAVFIEQVFSSSNFLLGDFLVIKAMLAPLFDLDASV